MPNGDGGGGGGGFDIGSLLGGLLGFLQAVVQAIINFLVALVQALVSVFNFIFKVLTGQVQFSLASLVETSKGYHTLFDEILGSTVFGFFSKVWSIIGKIRQWVGKLKRFLDQLRRIQQAHQLQAMRRMINLIQRIRRILVIFRVFHLKFATKLDNWLAGIEGLLIRREFEIARKTNEIIGWLNVILDPRALLRGPTLVNSLGGLVGGLRSLFDALGITALFPGIIGVVGADVPALAWGEVTAKFRRERRDGTGDYAAARAQAADFRALLNTGFSTGGG